MKHLKGSSSCLKQPRTESQYPNCSSGSYSSTICLVRFSSLNSHVQLLFAQAKQRKQEDGGDVLSVTYRRGEKKMPPVVFLCN